MNDGSDLVFAKGYRYTFTFNSPGGASSTKIITPNEIYHEGWVGELITRFLQSMINSGTFKSYVSEVTLRIEQIVKIPTTFIRYNVKTPLVEVEVQSKSGPYDQKGSDAIQIDE